MAIKTILIVDDNHLNRVVLATNLQDTGYNVETVTNGQEAIDLLNQKKFDAMLLDIMMPEVDGYQVLDYMKANNILQNVPVIMISVMDNVESIMRCIKLGASDYLPKPFNPLLLQVRLEAVLARNQLQLYTQELKKRNEELDAFASMVAHDLKNPLATILAITTFLQIGHQNISVARCQEQLNRLATTGQKMNTIIDELLLLAHLRKEDIKLVPVDMATVINTVQYRLTHLIERYQPQIRSPSIWPTGLGYGPWIEEIWANYLSNALKYGGQFVQIEFGYTLREDKIRFWVSDNGPGIGKNRQSQLFTPFTRLDELQLEGYGLGLSIVQRIAEKIDEQVGVESDLGQGSTFWFELTAANLV